MPHPIEHGRRDICKTVTLLQRRGRDDATTTRRDNDNDDDDERDVNGSSRRNCNSRMAAVVTESV